MSGNISTVGLDAPDSHMDIVDLEMFKIFDNSSCVIPASFRAVPILSILSPPFANFLGIMITLHSHNVNINGIIFLCANWNVKIIDV